MDEKRKEEINGFIGILAILIVFLLLSYFVQENIDFFQGLVGDNIIGVLIYMLILIAEVVLAPISALPLIAIVANLWSLWFVVLITLIAWTIGSVIAFVIARKYGVRLMKKFVSVREIHKIEKRIPREHLFAGVVLLRIALPIDLVSYALGLFTKMKIWRFALATFVGFAPLAFVFTYFGKLSFEFQFWVVSIFLVIYILFLSLRRLCMKKDCKINI
ncbi:MAG: TVP38/TMEM64 family protein [Minisyncoccales bacterium]